MGVADSDDQHTGSSVVHIHLPERLASFVSEALALPATVIGFVLVWMAFAQTDVMLGVIGGVLFGIGMTLGLFR